MAEPTPCLTGDLRTPGKRRAPQRHARRLAVAAGWVPSPNYSSRGGTKVTGVCIHTAEGPTDANSLGAYFARTSVQASSHEGADESKRVRYVDYAFEAWTLRNGNPWTDNLEMCGFASWTRAQWLAHPGMLRNAAQWVAERCHARNIPPRRITADDIRAGRRSGYFAHWDYTRGTDDGTHWDVGSNFPWDVFDGLVQDAYNGTTQEDDMPTADEIAQRVRQVLIDGSQSWSLSHIRDVVEATDTRVVALGAAVGALGDVKSLAAQIAADLPAAGPASEADVETALRNVFAKLGSLGKS